MDDERQGLSEFKENLFMADNVGNYALHAAIWDWGGYDRTEEHEYWCRYAAFYASMGNGIYEGRTTKWIGFTARKDGGNI